MSGVETQKSTGRAIDQRSLLERLQVLVNEARRQEQIEQKVWRGFLWGIPVIAGGVCLIALFFTLRDGFESLQHKVTYFFAEKISTQIVMVPRPVGPNPSSGFTEYVTFINNEMKTRTAALEKFEFAKNNAATGQDWSVGIRMHVRKDGSLVRAVVVVPSSIAAINQAACRAVYQIFPIAPPGELMYTRNEARIVRWLRFHHNGAALVERYDQDAFSSAMSRP